MTITLYGIANCDTVKKTRRWFTEHNAEITFHDFRKDGVDAQQLMDWSKPLGWEALLNRRGTTWRTLADDVKVGINEQTAIQVMLEHPAIIKRPVVDFGSTLTVGFSPEQWTQQL